MKLKSITIIISILILSSCVKENKAEDVVLEFFTAIDAKDFEKAKSLATNESAPVVDMMSSVGKFSGFLGNMIPKDFSNNISIVECEVKEMEGDCKCWKEGKVNMKEISVKKIDGLWKVHMTIESITGTDIDFSKVKETMKSVDMNKVMEVLSENSDSINKILEDFNADFKEKAIETIEDIEDNLDEVKESLQE